MRMWFQGFKAKDGAQTRDALAIVDEWRSRRQTPFHMVRAIRLYGALLRGDTSVLEEYFPLIRAAGGQRPTFAAPVPIVELVAGEDESSEDDFLDALGLGELEV
jgi:hypothetical protein